MLSNDYEETKAAYRDAILASVENGTEDDVYRALALADLWFLLVFVLGRRDADHRWIFDRCREVQAAPNGRLDLWAREHFKDLADDTPILTHNRGWTTHGALEVGDYVYCPDGRPVRVVALSPRYTTSECYQIVFSDGVEIVAGAGHLWRVRKKRKLRVGDWRLGRRAVEWDTEVVRTVDLPESADIGAMAAPIVGAAQQLPLDPYVLGVWLGDGSSSGPRITSSVADADEMESLLAARGVKVARTTHSNAVTLRIGNGVHGKKGSSEVAAALRALGALNNKHIPERYLRASAHQRMMLLRGLMDTDGTCNTRGTATFTSANERLAQQTYELASGLALRPRIRDYLHGAGPYKGNRFWQVSFQAHRDRLPFCMKRKAERAIESSAHRNCRDVVSVHRIESVPTRCIQVEGGMYLAGREFVPTHNSTIITYALTIQDILRDPDITVGIFSFNRPTAKAFLRQIKREFESNELLRRLFPDVIWELPHRDAPKWSEDDGIIVKREGNPKESTIEAWGLVDGQPTGKHFKLMVYDDVVTADSVTTAEMIEKVTRSWETSRNLTSEGGSTRYIGTRWHFNDTYRQILERGAAIERRHAVTEDGTVTGKPVLWTEARVAEKRREMGPYTFSAQLLLDPTADRTQGFREEWIRQYESGSGSFSGMNKYLLVDPANEKKTTSDYTAMVVIGLADDNNYYLLDGIRDRLSLRERGDALFALHRRWRPKGVGYERYGMQADVAYHKERMAQENYRFEITELGGTLAKPDRIRRMIPIFEAGRFHLPETLIKVDYEGKHRDLVTAFLNEEYRPFPVGLHDDFFDAIARITDPDLNVIWPKPTVPEVIDRYARPRKRPHRRISHMAA